MCRLKHAGKATSGVSDCCIFKEFTFDTLKLKSLVLLSFSFLLSSDAAASCRITKEAFKSGDFSEESKKHLETLQHVGH